MKKWMLVLGLGIFVQISHAQSDYVITAKGDTLRGEAKILTYDIIDRVQITSDKKKKLLTATEAKTLYIDNKFYKTVSYENRYRYMQVLKTGEYLSLYGFRMDKQFAYDGRYLMKRFGEGIEIPNLTFKKTMLEFLKDCESVSAQIKSGDLGRKDIDTLLVLYNACIENNVKQKESSGSVVNASETSLPAIESLRGKIEASALASKKDVLDLIRDIDTKVKAGQSVPNYLTEGLKGYLINTEYKADADALLEALSKK